MSDKLKSAKTWVIRELTIYLIYTLIFAFVFTLFSTYKRLILGEYAISYIHYEYNIVEAAILAKILIIGQKLNLGARFENYPLIYPVVCKTIIFSFLAFIFAILEHFIIGAFRGGNFYELYQELMAKNLYQILADMLVMSFVFLLFFAFFELARVIGEKKLYEIFFKRS